LRFQRRQRTTEVCGSDPYVHEFEEVGNVLQYQRLREVPARQQLQLKVADKMLIDTQQMRGSLDDRIFASQHFSQGKGTGGIGVPEVRLIAEDTVDTMLVHIELIIAALVSPA
jgi:hypothetical protein